MIIYERDHAGVSLSAAELAQLPLSNVTAFGYFTKEALRATILDFRDEEKAATRPGIRIYRIRNSGNTATLPSVVAVAVKEDGFDAVPFPESSRPWRRSQRLQSSGANSRPRPYSSPQLTFNAAFELSRDGDLSAYFSEAMLAPLLDDPAADGVTFYEVALDRSPKTRLSDHVSEQTGLTSYLAVATSLVDGLIAHDPARLGNNVLSDLPCPGYCLSLQAATAVVANKEVDFNGAPYLIRWQKT